MQIKFVTITNFILIKLKTVVPRHPLKFTAEAAAYPEDASTAKGHCAVVALSCPINDSIFTKFHYS